MIWGKFGKLPKKVDPQRRTLQLKDYIAAAVPIPPLHKAWSPASTSWPWLGNDVAGCCAVTAAGHLIQNWTTNDGAPFVPSTQQILDVYTELGGYDPQDPSTDRGLYMYDVLRHWKRHGIAGHTISAWVEVDPQSLRDVALALYWCGGLYAGFLLPESYQRESVWRDTDSPGRYGHATAIFDRSPFTLTCATWARLQRMLVRYLRRCDELYCPLSTDWTGPDEVAPNGLLHQELLRDLELVTR
jgi:hypothetical protein